MLSARTAPEAGEVTVFGDSETAMFAALWLAEQGKQVTLLSPADDLGVDTNDPERGHLAELLAADQNGRGRNTLAAYPTPDVPAEFPLGGKGGGHARCAT